MTTDPVPHALPPGYEALKTAAMVFVKAFERGNPHKKLSAYDWVQLCQALHECEGPPDSKARSD